MKDLFETFEAPIPRLNSIPEYIDRATEGELLARVDRNDWICDIKRRVQHYGYSYDYNAGQLTTDAHIGALPDWLSIWCERLHKDGVCSVQPDQVIVNEYLPGQGIASHIDRARCFGDPIIVISLGSSCIMDFTHDKTGEKIHKLLEPRSLYVLSGESRYDWLHGIRPRKTDRILGEKVHRGRRVSITFRNVILIE